MIDQSPAKVPAFEAPRLDDHGFLPGERRHEVLSTFRPLPLPNGFASGLHYRYAVHYPLSVRVAAEYMGGEAPSPVGAITGGVLRFALLTTGTYYGGAEVALTTFQSPFLARFSVFPAVEGSVGWVLGARGTHGPLVGAIEYRWDATRAPIPATPTVMLWTRF